MTVYKPKDYIRVLEPLFEAAYKTPEVRFKTLRMAAQTEGQEDESHFVQVTNENRHERLMLHRSWDVPVNTQASDDAVKRYLELDRKVYQYYVCFVPEDIEVDGETWYYIGKVADLKGASYRTAIEYAAAGFITSELLPVPSGYGKRRYVKPDDKLAYWVTNIEDDNFYDHRTSILIDALDKYKGNKKLFQDVQRMERERGLEVRGPFSRISVRDYYTKKLGRIPTKEQTWRNALLYGT